MNEVKRKPGRPKKSLTPLNEEELERALKPPIPPKEYITVNPNSSIDETPSQEYEQEKSEAKDYSDRMSGVSGFSQFAPFMQEEVRSQSVPESALDYNLRMVESDWGKDESISPELIKKLTKIKGFYIDQNGKPILNGEGEYATIKEKLWATLGFYTKDMRLSNLDTAQFRYCVHYTDLAADCLRVDMIEPFLVCLSRTATVLELSQSRGGFLRNRQNTLTTEQRLSSLEPNKRSLFTGKEVKRSGGY